MEEEIILKKTMFGGYSKEDVLKYIDSIMDKNEKKAEMLFEKIEDLTQENQVLKSKLNGNTKENDLESMFQENDVIKFPASLKELNSDETLSFIPEEMDIPEGNYFVDDEKNVHILQTPNPDFQVKGFEQINEEKELEKPKPPKESKALKAEFPLQKFSKKAKKEKLDDEIQKDLEIKKAKDQEQCCQNKMQDDIYFMEEIRELQDKINTLEQDLEQEKKKNLDLASKLEYSNDLFLKLYQGK